jgi:hypothetical protein
MDPRLRVGDPEREQTVAELQRFVSEGYLTLDEFEQRSAAAYRARTGSELAVLTEDLPRPALPARRPDGAGGLQGWHLPAPTVATAVVVAAIVLLAVVMVIVIATGGMGGMGGMHGRWG